VEGVAGGETIFTVTLDPATGGYSFTLAHQIDHPVQNVATASICSSAIPLTESRRRQRQQYLDGHGEGRCATAVPADAAV